MLIFRRLERFDVAAVQPLIAGYTSPAKYLVSKTETEALTVIELRLVQLEGPYVKRFEPLDQATIDRYSRNVDDGLSVAGYDEAGQMAAVALAEPHWWNKSLWVWEFHVAEAHRGRGVGRRLMELLTDLAQGAGLRVLVCETQNTNVPALAFYRRMGFAIEGVDLSYYTNSDIVAGEVAIFMKRHLA